MARINKIPLHIFKKSNVIIGTRNTDWQSFTAIIFYYTFFRHNVRFAYYTLQRSQSNNYKPLKKPLLTSAKHFIRYCSSFFLSLVKYFVLFKCFFFRKTGQVVNQLKINFITFNSTIKILIKMEHPVYYSIFVLLI